MECAIHEEENDDDIQLIWESFSTHNALRGTLRNVFNVMKQESVDGEIETDCPITVELNQQQPITNSSSVT